MKEQRAFKMVITGPPGVGKSSLLRRLTDDSFSQSYDVTVGAQFFSKLIYAGDNELVKLQIWDTAGQQTFHSLTKTFYRNSAAILLVYNMTDLLSFRQLDFWYEEAVNNSDEDTVFGLIGTQKDKQNERKVTNEMVTRFMEGKDNIAFALQTSAKTAQNVFQSFQEATKYILLKRWQLKAQHPKLEQIEETNKSCQC